MNITVIKENTSKNQGVLVRFGKVGQGQKRWEKVR